MFSEMFLDGADSRTGGVLGTVSTLVSFFAGSAGSAGGATSNTVFDKIGIDTDRNFPCQTLKIRKVSLVVMGS
jgi:hypothetical protein